MTLAIGDTAPVHTLPDTAGDDHSFPQGDRKSVV